MSATSKGAAAYGAASRPPKTPRPWPVPRVPSPSAEVIRAEWERGRPTPWVEAVEPTLEAAVPLGAPAVDASGRLKYTFVLEARADQVLLWVNRLSDETDLSTTFMERVEGTDLWAASFLMPAQWQASYCFLLASGGVVPWHSGGDQISLRAALDHGHEDDRNPVMSRNRAGVVQSVVQGPLASDAWAEQALVGCVEAASGWVRERRVVGGRDVVEHRPAEGEPGELPVLLVLDGEVWESHQALTHAVARLVTAGSLRPHRLVLLGSGGREQRWSDMAGGEAAFSDWIADVLVPELGLAARPWDVAVAGQSLGGLTALRAALLRSDAVGWCLAQSSSTWVEDLTAAARAWDVEGGRGGIHLAVGEQEWVLVPGHLALASALHDQTRVAHARPVQYVGHQGGHDYAWWRHALLEALLWQEEQRRGDARR